MCVDTVVLRMAHRDTRFVRAARDAAHREEAIAAMRERKRVDDSVDVAIRNIALLTKVPDNRYEVNAPVQISELANEERGIFTEFPPALTPRSTNYVAAGMRAVESRVKPLMDNPNASPPRPKTPRAVIVNRDRPLMNRANPPVVAKFSVTGRARQMAEAKPEENPRERIRDEARARAALTPRPLSAKPWQPSVKTPRVAKDFVPRCAQAIPTRLEAAAVPARGQERRLKF